MPVVVLAAVFQLLPKGRLFRPLLRGFENRRQSLDVCPRFLHRSADEVDLLMLPASQCGTTQVERDSTLSRAPRFSQLANGRDGRIDADAVIVTIVVATPAVLALVAIPHSIPVNKRDGQEMDVPGAACRRALQNRAKQSFQRKTGDRLTGMMAVAQQHLRTRLAVKPTGFRQFHAAAVECATETEVRFQGFQVGGL